MKIAAILTCFNRKEKTLQSLRHLYAAHKYVKSTVSLSVYLTDDGCTDGTADAVHREFQDVNILQGTGALFWVGGMINSWEEALKVKYDYFFLLNDDTFLFNNVFLVFFKTDAFSKSKFKKAGIYIGTTKDKYTQKISYGGAILTNIFLFKYKKLEPDCIPMTCNLGNANIMFISNEVVEKIGILYNKYKHGVADYDYTLMANKNKIPVLVMPEFCGICQIENHDKYEFFNNKTLKQRIKYLYAPTGLAYPDNLLFMKRNFPYRLPFVILAAWVKVLIPSIYTILNKNRN